MKKIVAKKITLDYETIEVFNKSNTILTKHLVAKKDDFGAFTIPCTIRACKFSKALFDLCARINLMPLVIFEESSLNNPLLTCIFSWSTSI